MATATATKKGAAAPRQGGGLPFGLKRWQVILVLVTLAAVGYYLYRRSQQGASTAPSAVDTSGATSGQPAENAVPEPAVTYNYYYEDTDDKSKKKKKTKKKTPPPKKKTKTQSNYIPFWHSVHPPKVP